MASEGLESAAIGRLRGLLANDLEAGFEVLVRSYSSLVYSLALRLTGSRADADDLSQETFLRAYASLRNFSPDRCLELKPVPWLATIGTNLWRNLVRNRLRSPSSLVPYDGERHDVAELKPGPEQAAIARDGWARLASLVVMLPEHYRVAVVLRHVIGLSYQEMSEVLKCPVGTAKARTSRGVTALRAMLQEQMADDGRGTDAPDGKDCGERQGLVPSLAGR